MRWEEMLLDLFEDLEQQAEGLQLLERDAEVADRIRGEYAVHVDLASRLHASVGAVLRLVVDEVGTLQGRLVSAGDGWALIADDVGHEWLVRLAAVVQLAGVSARSVGEAARPVTTRLGLASALRRLSGTQEVLVHLRGGPALRGRLARVGADFVEIDTEDRREGVVLVPFERLTAVRPASMIRQRHSLG
jgi:hypothetical protein